MTEVFIITGVTCSGKTSMSMELARREGAEIISCDSVQIYRGMDIGSAKASAEEMSEIPPHLVDVCDCDKHFDVSEYVALAKKALEDIAARGKKIIVCGGSGFYLRAWFAAVTDGVGIPSEIKSVCDEIEQRGASALKEALLKIDPAAADTVDILNLRRALHGVGNDLRRALREVCRPPLPNGQYFPQSAHSRPSRLRACPKSPHSHPHNDKRRPNRRNAAPNRPWNKKQPFRKLGNRIPRTYRLARTWQQLRFRFGRANRKRHPWTGKKTA